MCSPALRWVWLWPLEYAFSFSKLYIRDCCCLDGLIFASFLLFGRSPLCEGVASQCIDLSAAILSCLVSYVSDADSCRYADVLISYVDYVIRNRSFIALYLSTRYLWTSRSPLTCTRSFSIGLRCRQSDVARIRSFALLWALEHSNSRFESIRIDSFCKKKSAFDSLVVMQFCTK